MRTIFTKGTIWKYSDLISSEDDSSFVSYMYLGREYKLTHDKRLSHKANKGWALQESYVFTANFSDGSKVEIIVNAEFGSVENAQKVAELYGNYLGKLPPVLLDGTKQIWIHGGDHHWGGGDGHIQIHHGKFRYYEEKGVVEEVIIHEGVHAALDAKYGRSNADWKEAQLNDDCFVSAYAAEHPEREDMAESFLCYLAVKKFRNKLSEEDVKKIEDGIPNRLDYFESLDLDLGSRAVKDEFNLTWDELLTSKRVKEFDLTGNDFGDGLQITHINGMPLAKGNSTFFECDFGWIAINSSGKVSLYSEAVRKPGTGSNSEYSFEYSAICKNGNTTKATAVVRVSQDFERKQTVSRDDFVFLSQDEATRQGYNESYNLLSNDLGEYLRITSVNGEKIGDGAWITLGSSWIYVHSNGEFDFVSNGAGDSIDFRYTVKGIDNQESASNVTIWFESNVDLA